MDSTGTGPRPDEAARLHQIWNELDLPGVIDVHTHFMPDNVMAKVWSYFDNVGSMTGVDWPITYRMAEDARVERLRSFGVTAFSSMIYAHKPDMAAWLNSWGVEFADRHPDCLHTATFFPEPGVVDDVGAVIDRGARVFKVHLQVGGFDPNDPSLTPVWETLEQRGIPVVIHCGSGPTPGAFTGPSHIGTLLARRPELKLIVAHLGMPEYSEFLDLVERYPGVHLDTTMAFTDFTERLMPFPPADVSRLAALGDRVLLGSDFPNIPYPYLHQIEALVDLGLGREWLRGVLHDNAARLFGLTESVSPSL